MYKKLLKSEKCIYKIFDEIYKLIPDDSVNKAKYQSDEERFLYQKTFSFPLEYPCVILYDLKLYNHSNYYKPHIHNKDCHMMINVEFVYLNDFKEF